MKTILTLAIVTILLASCSKSAYVYCPAYAQNDQEITSYQPGWPSDISQWE